MKENYKMRTDYTEVVVEGVTITMEVKFIVLYLHVSMGCCGT